MIKITDIRENYENPRVIDPVKFDKLRTSLKSAPWMMKLRPIIVDDDGMILGGNMRYKALVENRIQELPDEWVLKASQLTKKQKREFVVKDNLGYGDWDFELLNEQYDKELLDEWGFDLLFIGADDDGGVPEGGGEGEGDGDADPEVINCPKCGHEFVVVTKK